MSLWRGADLVLPRASFYPRQVLRTSALLFLVPFKRFDDSQPPVVMATHRGCRIHPDIHSTVAGFREKMA
jgi:hypothetical protein